ncbi:MAG: hypothetical protein EPN97_10600 [Alphaproteobacteria bacterium]|nr:MAG: hypothetical protein EPN97_10600 [Alphaproteobacteria bacterium]
MTPSPESTGRYGSALEEIPGEARPLLAQALDILAMDKKDGERLVRLLCEQGLPLKFFPEEPGKGGGAVTLGDSAVEDGRVKLNPESVGLYPGQTLGATVMILAHELRHLEQLVTNTLMLEQQGKIVPPVEAVLYTYMIEADAQATATEISFLLMKQGKPEAWEYITKEESNYKDMADGYKNATVREPGAEESGYARKMAFNKWFTTDWSLGYASDNIDYRPSDNIHREMLKGGARIENMEQGDFAQLGKYLANADPQKYAEQVTVPAKDLRRVEQAEKDFTRLTQDVESGQLHDRSLKVEKDAYGREIAPAAPVRPSTAEAAKPVVSEPAETPDAGPRKPQPLSSRFNRPSGI